MRSRVPVVVLSGALGSGKTTLLNHVLRTSGGRIGVVVNDFGAVDVDALLLHGQVDTTAISGGCLCCLSDTSELDAALRRLARLGLDAIVVEASGLAEPRELARMVVASEVPTIRFGGVVEVLDASRWTDGPPVAPDHLRVASLLVVAKGDRAVATPEAIDADLAEHAPGTPVVHVEHGRIDPALLFDVADRPEPTGQLSLTDLLAEDASGEHHEHAAYASLVLDGDRPLHPARLVDLLDAPPVGVYRTKGIVDVSGVGRLVVHGVGEWFALERAARALPAAGLVVIGTGIDEAEVRHRLDALPTRPDEEIDADAAYRASRHLPRR